MNDVISDVIEDTEAPKEVIVKTKDIKKPDPPSDRLLAEDEQPEKLKDLLPKGDKVAEIPEVESPKTEEPEEEVIEEESVEDLYDKQQATSVEDLKKSFDSLKVDAKKEDLKEIEEKVKKKAITNDAEKLYEEFSTFLEQKAGITSDKTVKEAIPTGIDLLDAILGGGFVIGAMSIIVGAPGSGKTMLAIQTLASGQKILEKEIIGAFLDSEEATTGIRLSNLGVRNPKINPYADVTVEKVFKFIEGLCLFKELKKMVDNPSVVIWDSIANTLSQKERETEDINSVIGYKARLLSFLIPKYVAKCSSYNIAFIAINQLRDVLQLSQFSPAKDLKFMSHTKDMPGGNSLKFNAFQLVEMKVKKAMLSDQYGFDGIIASVKTVKNKLFAPNIEIEIAGSFTTGFSNYWTNYINLVKTKKLKAAGWSYLISLPETKFRTKDSIKLYETNPIFKEHFDKASKDAINELVSKYEIVD